MQVNVSSPTEKRPKRLTREESRALTRERLIESARRLFATEGIEATAIDRIAEEAGYSRGAFYSNFETKDELLRAILEREAARTAQEVAELSAGEPNPEQMVDALRQYALAVTTDRMQCLFYMELEMYGVRHPEARESIADCVNRETSVAARFVDLLFEAYGVTEHPASELIVSSFIGMAQGLTMRQVLDPHVLSDEVLRSSLGLYFDSVITNCIPQLRERARSA